MADSRALRRRGSRAQTGDEKRVDVRDMTDQPRGAGSWGDDEKEAEGGCGIDVQFDEVGRIARDASSLWICRTSRRTVCLSGA